ncbi:MAG TPA: DUF3592 domain-containing protein [Chitinophagaceae bacterium]|nr:DUF3592 domain-containing protein [Chitinophagaceae bacterium]
MSPKSIYKYSRYYWAIVFILLPLFIYELSIRKYNNAEFVNGKIIYGLEGRAGRYGTKYYYPQYEFQYNDSTYYYAREGFDIRDFPVGSNVKIYFPKRRPEESSIYTFLNFWLSHVAIVYYIFIAIILYFLPAIFFAAYKDTKNK